MKKIAFILIIMFMLLQTGCWNAREINELGFVLSIGLDKAQDGFKVTAQFAKPDIYSKTPSGGAGAAARTFWTLSSTGKTIFEAIRNMAAISSRRIFWAHIRVIIISEELAKENTLEILDFFTRNPELRLRTLIAVTPGEAGKIFDVVPEMEKDPALYLEKIIQNKNLTSKSYDIMLKDFLEDYLDPSVGPVTSRIVLDKSGSQTVLKASGAYVFDENKLAVPLNEDETRGLLWIKKKIRSSIMVVNCPFDNLPITFEIKKSKVSIKSQIDNGIPNFTIKVGATAYLTEQGCITDFSDPKNLESIKKELESSIQKDIQSTVAKAMDIDIDFLDFSHSLHVQHKNEWKKMSANWNEILKKSMVNITVKVDVPNKFLAEPLVPIKNQGKNGQ